MKGLDRLQKEIDALSYNSRSVLNALIRSVVAAGSNRGFKVTRAEGDIFLSRIDIYRIYKFYQDWEDNLFSTVDKEATSTQKAIKGFDTLLVQHDATPVKDDNGNVVDTTPTTVGLVKHSKIMFQTADNVNQITNDFWLNLIKNATNAKLITNSAPIPINLRTPIMDENLATTKYNTHPTFLFPMDYFTLDVLGFSGDNTDHTLAGRSWVIKGDEFVRLETPSVSMGDVDAAAIYKTKANRTGLFSTSFGFDSHARGDYSLAGGIGSMVPGNINAGIESETNIQAAIAVGYQNISSNDFSISIGGRGNSTSGSWAGIIAGNGNVVTSNLGGILAGSANRVGGQVFTFKFPTTAASVVDACAAEKQALDVCLGTTQTDLEARNNVILISGDHTEGFQEGDIVRLFDYIVGGRLYHETNGDGEKAGEFLVAANPSYIPFESTSPDKNNTVITLNRDVSRAGTITGGRVSRIFDSLNSVFIGETSMAIGNNLKAEGVSQVVVGVSNAPNYVSKFIVGTGEDANTFEVAPGVTYLLGTPGNSIDFPTETNGAFVGMKFDANGLDALIRNSRLTVSNPLFKYTGKPGESEEYSITASDTGIDLLNKTQQISLIAGTGTFNTAIIGTDTKNIKIFADSNILIEAHDILNITATNSITIQSTSSNISILNGGNFSLSTANLAMKWTGSLSLDGNSFGALPTSSKQYTHDMTNIALTPFGSVDGSTKSIFRSGFYSGSVKTPITQPLDITTITSDALAAGIGASSDGAYHILNIGRNDNAGVGNKFNWQMSFAQLPTTDVNDTGRILVTRNAFSADNSIRIYGQNDYLPFMRDIQYADHTGVYKNFGKWTDFPVAVDTLAALSGHNSHVYKVEAPSAGTYSIGRTLSMDGFTGYNISTNYGSNISTGVLKTSQYTFKGRYTIIGKTFHFEILLSITDSSILKTDDLGPLTRTFCIATSVLNSITPSYIDGAINYTPMFPCTRYYEKNLDIDNDNLIDDSGNEIKTKNIFNIHVATRSAGNKFFVISKSASYVDRAVSPDSNDLDGFRENAFTTQDANRLMFFSGSFPIV